MAGYIMVGVDGSAPSMAAVDWAAADALRRGLSLLIVHVCGQGAYSEGATDHGPSVLAAAGDRAREQAREIEVNTELLSGKVIDTLNSESANADSVVLGSRGLGGFAGLVVGSVGLGVAGHATGAVVIVRRPSEVRHDRVVVGYDGSGHSEAAMQYAIDQARARKAELQVIYAWQTPTYSPYAAGYQSVVRNSWKEELHASAARVEGWRDKNPDIRIVSEQVTGHPVTVLISAGSAADLVVVGSRGLGGFASAVFGSVSHGVLHHVAGPVAVVRPRRNRI